MNQLLTQCYSGLLGQASVILGNMPSMAQTMQPADLLHLAIEKLYKAPPVEIRPHPSEFGGLMRIVMKRTLIDSSRRANARRRPNLRNAVGLDEASNVADPDSAFQRIDLDHAMAQLTAHNEGAAELLHLTYFEGRTGVELAMRLQVTRTEVSRRLKQALTRMKAIMEDAEYSRDLPGRAAGTTAALSASFAT